MAAPPYKLSCTIYGHNADVRAVNVTEDGKIISGSRDMTAKLWTSDEGGPSFRECLTMTSHENFVSCVCALPPSKKFSYGLIITGSNDKVIRLYDRLQSQPIQVLNGHNNTVCKVVPGVQENTIISSSWDHTAKMWDLESFREIATFSGHEAAVWAAIQLPCGVVATGSADTKIKIWIKNGSCLKTLSGHKDCVRDIALAGPEEILSCSNDTTVKHWQVESGQCLNTYYGHGHFIYSIFSVDFVTFLTSSEDHTVKVWNSGEVVETIQIPAGSVWSVAALPNGDVVTGSRSVATSADQTINRKTRKRQEQYRSRPRTLASVLLFSCYCFDVFVDQLMSLQEDPFHPLPINIIYFPSDGVVRVFSRDPARQASPEELKVYEDELSNLENATSQNLGDIKVSELPGEEALYEPGRKDGQTLLIRKEKEVLAYTWSTSEGKWNLIGNVTGSVGNEGMTETGKPTYNGKEYDYVFSVDIEPEKPLLKLPYNKSDDPWHAAQKFIHDNNLSQHFLDEVANFIIKNSQQNSQQTNSSSEYVDPFTGAARYIPGSNSGTNGVNSAGQISHSVASKFQQKGSEEILTNSYFPQREFLRFDQANLALILEKLLEFNKKSGDGNEVISDDQIENLVKICEAGASCSIEDLETLNRLLKWPEEIVFPVLDVMRLAIRNKEANNYLCNDKLLPGLMKYLSPESTVSSNTMLALRVLTNMLTWEAGKEVANKNKIKLLNIIENIPPPYSKPVQIAMATLLLNLTVLIRRSETPAGRTEALVVMTQILSKLTDHEALLRAFVALGTLLVDAVDSKSHSPTFTPILIKYQNDSSFGSKIRECCQYILQVLQ